MMIQVKANIQLKRASTSKFLCIYTIHLAEKLQTGQQASLVCRYTEVIREPTATKT